MMKLAYIALILVIATSLPQTLSFHRCSNVLVNREVRSRQSSALPAINDLSQIVSTTITSATIEVASNEIVAKQIFEPQMSAETGIGIAQTLFLSYAILSFLSTYLLQGRCRSFFSTANRQPCCTPSDLY